MNRKRILFSCLCGSVVLQTAASSCLPALAKAWTVEQRQAKLMQDINSGQKTGKLSVEDARKLRKNLADVARKKKKLKAKDKGQLSPEATAKLQKTIDKSSHDIKVQKGDQPK